MRCSSNWWTRSYDAMLERTCEMDGSRFALVVANDQYDDPGLRRLIAPAQDAAASGDQTGVDS